jgi:hypothetical protein
MKKTRPRVSPEAMRSAISVGNALVRSGYVSEREMGVALGRVAAGDFNGADVFIAHAARLRRATRRTR